MIQRKNIKAFIFVKDIFKVLTVKRYAIAHLFLSDVLKINTYLRFW